LTRTLGALALAGSVVFGGRAYDQTRPPGDAAFRGLANPLTEGGEWLDLAALPYPLAHHMTAFVQTDSGPRLFVFGGQRAPGAAMEQTCLQYVPRTDSWSGRASMRYPRGQGQAVALCGKVYVMGGYQTFGTGLTKVEVYDPTANTWTVGPDMPESLYDFEAVAWRDSLIFVLGGGSWSPGLPPTELTWLFDAANRVWRPATPMPCALGALGAGACGDTILVATGWTDSGPTNKAWRGVVDPADPTVIDWTELDTLPGLPRCRCVSACVAGHLVIAGGVTWPTSDPAPDSSLVLDETWSLDPATGHWRQLPSKPHPVCAVAGSAVSLRNRLYIPGGDRGTAPYTTEHAVLDLAGCQHDVGVSDITSPVGRLTPLSPGPVAATLRNFGGGSENVRAHAVVTDTGLQLVVFESDTVLSLEPDTVLTIQFGSFVPDSGRWFKTEASVALDGDENPDNDTLRRLARTTLGSNPDGFGYAYQSTQEPDTVRFTWFDTTGGTLIDNWAPNPDDGSSLRHLPFTFPFYGTSFNRMRVCTNGFLDSSGFAPSLNHSLPEPALTNLIAPFWDDLDLRSAGSVCENLSDDRAVYTWTGVPRYGASGDSLTFQVALDRNGSIRFNYLKLVGDRTSGTTGIQGEDGSWDWYSEYCCNGVPLSHTPADSVSVVFYPTAAGFAEAPSTRARPSRLTLAVPTLASGAFDICLTWRGDELPGLSVFDVLGRPVRRLKVDGQGKARLVWDGRDARGDPAPNGAYFLRASTSDLSVTRKALLLR